MTTHTVHDLYAAQRSELTDTLRSLTAEQAATPVPTCPGWSVKDVMAHVSGLVAEKLAEVPPPLGSDEATARQVQDRAGMSLAEVCDEWEHNASAFSAVATDDSPFIQPFLCDLVVHSHDIQEALSLPIDATSPATVYAAERYLGLLQERAAEQDDVALTVDLTDGHTHEAAAGSTPLTLRATAFDVLRSVTARRTRSEVAGLDWSADPSALLDSGFAQYGALTD
ncbi:MAG: maleylpyruvate isomerase family mycothiol-dependent enzyme [Acidimicrobiales bacterium]|nr:maleylpyruvate isomerase family mycothiol-dependent enzyme [Acidimicrobiales bacterium]RZV48299.1 MAG: maleylpyruvate isomerase family mycothiol-dependent enzyme [Acidimicrobiales bacterium]